MIRVSVGIDDFDVESISIFPNPNSGNFKINLNNIQGKLNYKMYDSRGRLVLEKNTFITTEKFEEISTHLENGIYHLVIVTEKEILTRKVVIAY